MSTEWKNSCIVSSSAYVSILDDYLMNFGICRKVNLVSEYLWRVNFDSMLWLPGIIIQWITFYDEADGSWKHIKLTARCHGNRRYKPYMCCRIVDEERGKWIHLDTADNHVVASLYWIIVCSYMIQVRVPEFELSHVCIISHITCELTFYDASFFADFCPITCSLICRRCDYKYLYSQQTVQVWNAIFDSFYGKQLYVNYTADWVKISEVQAWIKKWIYAAWSYPALFCLWSK